MERDIVQMSNPRYFGLFNPGANFPAQCADQIKRCAIRALQAKHVPAGANERRQCAIQAVVIDLLRPALTPHHFTLADLGRARRETCQRLADEGKRFGTDTLRHVKLL